VHHWALDDLVIDTDSASPARLPIVADPTAAVWRDRVDATTYWYAPAYELVMPQGSDTLDTTPFLFRFWRVGAASSGVPVLRATVRFTLRPTQSAATRSAIQQLGAVTVKAIDTSAAAVSLVVPYVDATDGSPRTTTLRATTERDGDDIVATIELLDPVVRCCYGALAVPGFQATPARVSVSYSYACYVPVQPQKLQVVAGGKRSFIPVVSSRDMSAPLPDDPYFDANTTTFRTSGGELRLTREGTAGSTTARRPPTAVLAVAAQPAHLMHSAVTVAPAATVTIVRPPVVLSSVLASFLQRVQYARRTLLREDALDTLVPCSGLGAFYVEGEDETPRAVGCVEALRLGQASLRLYDEIPELAHAAYRVFRALQQPGRFLILPTQYRITRFDRSIQSKAYRPTVCMYAAIDPSTPSNNRIVFTATLEPDIAVHLRRVLFDKLSREARDPIISYPTELPIAAQYDWSVGSLLQVQPEVVRAPDHFQVSLSTDVPGALLLRSMLQTSGVYGSARFTLSDGMVLQTVLALELTQIIGPWSTGPVEVVLSGTTAQLTNRVERSLDVSDLAVFRAAGRELVPVEARLASNEVRTVTFSSPATEAYAVTSAPTDVPIILEEIRTFVEDVHTNVIFVDLIDHPSHDLQGLSIQARLKDVPGTSDVMVAGDPPRGTLELLLPLTTYLQHTVLQFAVRKSFVSGPEQTTPWIEWDLERAGNVISLTWELIGS
jgi:hypothetical protein